MLIKSKQLKPPATDLVEVCLFGDGYGESILMHVPGIGWGVVDCCQYRIHNKVVVPATEYLRNIYKGELPQLAFAALTHPHEDHYLGFASLLGDFQGKIRSVGLYEGTGMREYKTYVAQQAANGLSRHPFALVYKSFRDAKNHGAIPISLGERTSLASNASFLAEGGNQYSSEIIALSPSPDSVEEYRNILFRNIPELGKPVRKVPDNSHNLLSVAMLVRAGETCVLLGSDVEIGGCDFTGWRAILSHNPGLMVNCLKVPHHGAKSAFHEEFWKSCITRDASVAMVAPFVKGRQVLPTSSDVNRMKEYCNTIGITNPTPLNKSNKKTDSAVSRVHAGLRSYQYISRAQKFSMLQVRFDLNSHLVSKMQLSPAKWL